MVSEDEVQPGYHYYYGSAPVLAKNTENGILFGTLSHYGRIFLRSRPAVPHPHCPHLGLEQHDESVQGDSPLQLHGIVSTRNWQQVVDLGQSHCLQVLVSANLLI